MARMRGQVKLIEPLGAETYVHAQVEQDLVVARLGAETPPAIDGPIELVFNPATSHYFAAGSGERLDSSAPS
jgi:ABC-type sugar transport system ATPase subunit